jgi:predicted alpha/beta hydrolase family esterase
MRHLIVMSGNSVKNKAWGELILEHYAPQYDSSFLLEYDHWVSGEPNIDFAKETAKLQKHVDALSPDTEIILFAKSAGSLLGLLTMYQGIYKPTRAVFFGMPLDLAADNLFKDSWAPLSELAVPAIAFHNVADPTTSYEFTKSMLATHNPHITLITTAGNDHWYSDLKTYDSFINQIDA